MTLSPKNTSSSVCSNTGHVASASNEAPATLVTRYCGAGGSNCCVRKSTTPLPTPSRWLFLSSSATGTMTRGSLAARVTMFFTIFACWLIAQNLKNSGVSACSSCSSTSTLIVSLA